MWHLMVLLGLGFVCGASADASNVNNDFESGFYAAKRLSSSHMSFRLSGQIANAWEDNSSWSDARVHYAVEKGNPHAGKFAQSIKVNHGAVQFVQRRNSKANATVIFSVWLRGSAEQSVSIALRQPGAPYTTYAERLCRLSAEWREYSVQGKIGEAGAVLLMIKVPRPMSIWVDSVRFGPYVAPHITQDRNVITNGSFESGVGYGWSAVYNRHPDIDWLDPQLSTYQPGKIGKQSLAVPLPGRSRVQLHSPLLRIVNKKHYVIGLWVKASKSMSATVDLVDAGITRHVSIGTQWQHIKLGGVATFKPYTWLRITASHQGDQEAMLFVDGVEVHQGDALTSEYRAAFAFEMSLAWSGNFPGSIFTERETPRVSYTLSGVPPTGSVLHCEVIGLDDRVLERLHVPAQNAGEVLLTAGQYTRGVFMIRAQLHDKTGEALSSVFRKSFSRLPLPRKSIGKGTSYFGNHIPLNKSHIAIMRRTGQRFVRLHDASMIGKWALAEAQEGQFTFYDTPLEWAKQEGLTVLGMLDGAPLWMGSEDRGGYWNNWTVPTRSDHLQKWQHYISTVASHYKGLIDHWEVYNEPWGKWWHEAGGSVKTYAELLTSAYRLVHRVNKDAVVLGVGSYQGQDTWHNGVLSLTGTKAYDGFSFHHYTNAIMGGGAANPIAKQADQWRTIQMAYGSSKPLWNTEGGVLALGSWYAKETGGMPARDQAGYIIKYDVSSMAAGIKAFFYYATHGNPAHGETFCRATEWDRSLKPLLAARAILAYYVDGAGTPVYVSRVRGLDGYRFRRHHGVQVTVWWASDGATHKLTPISGSHFRDAFGNLLPIVNNSVTVSSQPMYQIQK